MQSIRKNGRERRRTEKAKKEGKQNVNRFVLGTKWIK